MRHLLLFALLVPLVGLASGCHTSRRHAEPPMPGTVPSTSEDKLIAAIISSAQGQAFGFFPNHPGRQRCLIPGGGPGPGLRVKGVCLTRVVYNFGGRPPDIEFVERWPWRGFHYAGAPRRRQSHHWQFGVTPSGKATLRKQGGDFPPQWVR
jgi:hypothetical protein